MSWLKTAAMLLAFLAGVGHPLTAQTQTQQYYLAPNPQILGPDGVAQPFVCQTATCATANAGAEVLYIKTLGTNTCNRFWSQSIDGDGQTNLSDLYSGLPNPASFNTSTPRYSPDGQWIVVAAQDTHSTRACTEDTAKPGAGFGYGLFVCRVSSKTCYEMPIEGDNSPHCAAGAACPVSPAVLTDWVDDVHGVLHWYFTPDQTKIYGMYVMGATMFTPERLNGTARWADINLPASGAPTISNVTETDVPPLGNGTGAFNWYEGAGALPLSVEPSTCTLFFTSINNASGSFNNTGILQYNICTAAYKYLPPLDCYQEHWSVRTQGDIAVGISACYLPVSLPFSLAGGVSGPTDLSSGPPTVGKTTQLTFYDNLHPLGNPITSMSDPGWDWTGNYVVAEYVLADNATHAATTAYIMKYTLIIGEAVTTVSAASYLAPVAPDSIITLFGNNIATQVSLAPSGPPVPLPTSLGNVTATVTDASGHMSSISLLAVTLNQINAVLPAGLQSGPATIDVITSSGNEITGNVTVAAVAPSLFTANYSGRSTAAAQVTIVHADGSQSYIPAIATCSSSGCTPIPINLGSSTDQAYLVLFGTGIRGAGGASAVTATVGTTPCTVTYAGPQNTYFGLDQVNVELPHSLAGSGTVNVVIKAAGQTANTVTVDIQ